MNIKDHITQINLSSGEFVFREGDAPDGNFYFIFSGEISFCRARMEKSYVVNKAGVGEFFGEMALLSKLPRALSAQVLSNKATIGKMDKIAFLEICTKNPTFTYNLIKSIVQRLGNAEDKIHRLLEEFEEIEMIEKAKKLDLMPVSLPPLDILNFVNNVPTRTHLRGEFVLREGEKTDGSIFFLFAGELIIVKGSEENRELIRSLQPGEFFGEISMISHNPFMASVIVESATARIARLDEDIFIRIARNSPEFLFLILQNMIGKLTQREDLIDRLMILQQGGEPIQYAKSYETESKPEGEGGNSQENGEEANEQHLDEKNLKEKNNDENTSDNNKEKSLN